MRVLQESADPRAVAAVEYFIYAMTKYAGAYAAVLGGLDEFVFTAGIGEHSVPVPAAVRQACMARREARPGGEHLRQTAHFRRGQRRVGLGHDRPAYAGDRSPLSRILKDTAHGIQLQVA
jgi:acetate kinase